MLSPLIQQVLSAYRAELETRFGARLRRVVVFGSWARGEATEASDLDVAVIIDGLTPAEWMTAVGCAAEVQVRHELPFSPFVVSTERFARLRAQGGIGKDIEQEGVSA